MDRRNKIGLTLDRLFYQTLTRSPERKVIYKDEIKTYKELYRDILQLSAGILEKYNSGIRMAVLDWNTIPYLQLLFAIPCSGNIIHPVNMRLPADELVKTVRVAGDKVLFFSREFLPIARKIEQMGLIKGEEMYLMDGSDLFPSYQDLFKSDSKASLPNLDENTPASVLFTSGTTGSPKGVIYSHRKIMMGIWSILTLLSAYPGNARMNSNDVIFSLIPNYHLWSWGTPYIATMIGANYVMDGKFDLTSTIDAISRNKVTWMSMVPTMLYGLLSHPSSTLKGLKVMVGGSPIPSGLINAATAKGVELTSIYGFTDGLIAGIGSTEEDEQDLGKRNSLSTSGVIPAPLSEYQIKTTSEGQIGEIYFRSPWLPEGYENEKEESAESFTSDGWFRTGDAGTLNNGRVQVSDRVKDLIKSGAEFIPSAVLESAISDIPEVESVAVIGIPDSKWGERPIAYVKPRSIQEFDESKVKSYLMSLVNSGKIQKWWIPDKFVTIGNMPMTGTGKIDKKALRKISGGN
ncbi:MAG: AMP-binding protein [Thermoplasmatales archaeon]